MIFINSIYECCVVNCTLSEVHLTYACPIYYEKEDQNNMLRCEGTKIWRDEVMDYRINNIDAEIGNRGRVGCKSKEQ